MAWRLQRMRNQQKAAERKAKKAAEGGEAPAKKKPGRKRAAPVIEDEDEPEGEGMTRPVGIHTLHPL